MKKFCILLSCLFSLSSFSQSFYKNALVTWVDFGVDAYVVQYHYSAKLSNNSTLNHDETSGAASHGVALAAEYGLAKWFGLGIKLKPDNFYTKYDSTTMSKPSASSFEGAVVANFHVVKTTHFDLPIGIDLGFSSLNYRQNDVTNTQVYGSGTYADLHINPRFYFGRFGLNINLSFPALHYNITTNNSTFNQYILADWKGTGFGFSFGAQYRFLSAK